ncbi:cell division protein FtsL [Halorhodospira halochloris]|uniref:Cell division protein FtsL n=1 Tax=Halorhodospira halochloris TaxID=1052 RepID=A0A0X8XAW0_HALHR|nr:cell division protein FtsL [Halorhodospira halochloris]MBK1651655.1 cell division protein FtsL [Halorhodospira halochloris]MCG5529577.1 cell division protein FtsL [Halorhodospira halochloris]BAU58519.1 cell division protein FtsL [Halorhodospira halochloris]
MSRQQITTTVLIVAVVCSALAVVVAQHERRAGFVALQDEHDRADRLREEWSMLQLELSALAGHSRLERIARSELGMVTPGRDDVVILKRR